MLPFPSIFPTLGLYHMASRNGCMSSDRTQDVCIGFTGSEEQYILAWMYLWQGLGVVCFVMVLLL